MPTSEPKQWICSTQPASMAGMSVGCGLSAKCVQTLPFRPELLAVGRQQQLDRGGVEADAVIEPADAIGCVDPLDGEHRRQDLRLGDRGGIAGEQRLDVEGLVRLDDEVHQVAGDIDARHLVDDLVHLRDDEAALEARRLDDRRRVFGIGAGIEIAVLVGADRGDQRHLRREVDEVAGEELQIGMDGAKLDLAAEQHARDARRLRAGIGIVEPRARCPSRRRRGARAARRPTAPCADRGPCAGSRSASAAASTSACF